MRGSLLRSFLVLHSVFTVARGDMVDRDDPTERTTKTDADPLSEGYGHGMLGEFLLDPAYINLNHGSFGTVARSVLEAQQGYVLQQEARPDPWFRCGGLASEVSIRDI